MNCQTCGKPLADGARFCPSCGAAASAPSADQPTEFHIVGDVMQAVVIPLRGGQEVQAEPGALLYMAGDVEMQSAMKGGLWGGLRRMVANHTHVFRPCNPVGNPKNHRVAPLANRSPADHRPPGSTFLQVVLVALREARPRGADGTGRPGRPLRRFTRRYSSQRDEFHHGSSDGLLAHPLARW